MKKSIFLTGYPGFLAIQFVSQLFKDYRESIDHVYLLVLPTERKKAENELIYFLKSEQLSKQMFTVVEGDITTHSLGIKRDLNNKIRSEVTHVFHLAAIYDLAVPKDIAERVNIQGTRLVNEWTTSLPNIQRYTYFSTAYVSGTREGRIFEHELDMGQSFRNHYERTKYEAELLVNKVKERIPTTIIRPGIVKGHSQTGQTIKFDGLYFMLHFYDRLRRLPFIPYLKAGSRYPEGNFVPSDYVLQATSYLSMHAVGEGKTYHLTDPRPYNMKEIQKMICEYYLGTTPKGEVPISVANLFLRNSLVRKWLQVEREAMDYFTIHSSYDAQQAVQDLQAANIVCPDLKDTLSSMISFYRKYKDDRTKYIKIK